MSFTKEWFVNLLGWKYDSAYGGTAVSPCGRLWVCRPGQPDMRAVFRDGDDCTCDRIFLPAQTFASPNHFLWTCRLFGVSTGHLHPTAYSVWPVPKYGPDHLFLSEGEARASAPEGCGVRSHFVEMGVA